MIALVAALWKTARSSNVAEKAPPHANIPYSNSDRDAPCSLITSSNPRCFLLSRPAQILWGRGQMYKGPAAFCGAAIDLAKRGFSESRTENRGWSRDTTEADTHPLPSKQGQSHQCILWHRVKKIMCLLYSVPSSVWSYWNCQSRNCMPKTVWRNYRGWKIDWDDEVPEHIRTQFISKSKFKTLY